MKVLMIDCDTLRPDHLGCYGYPRNTSASIDSVAGDGVCFADYYCSDAPCLPSRAALMTGKFGFHTGVVGHGGTAADMRLDGPERAFGDRNDTSNLPTYFRHHGMYTASISTFAERHGAWWFNAGFNETLNLGTGGMESAEAVTPLALDWLERNKDREDWFLHVHYWDPHTPHRAPAAMGNPFENEPAPQMKWMDETLLQNHRNAVGPHTAQDLSMYDDKVDPDRRQLGRVDTLADFKQNIDNYDCGIYWMDKNIGQILDLLKRQGIYEDTAIIITADHGENEGELGIYNEHGTADEATTHIPLIIKWPGCEAGAKKRGLLYNVDLLPTMAQLLDRTPGAMGKTSTNCGFLPQPNMEDCDGISFAEAILPQAFEPAVAPTQTPAATAQVQAPAAAAAQAQTPAAAGSQMQGKADTPPAACGRPYLVVSQCAHVCQRAVRFGDWLYIRTYHDGFHLFDDEMLFNIAQDPHELCDVKEQHPDICHEAVYYLEQWTTENMKKQVKCCQIDPLWTVIAEGGPFHAKGNLKAYTRRLEATGRGWGIEELMRRHPEEF